MADKWDGIEQHIHSGKKQQLSKYFRERIQEDMKEGMLISTQRKACLGDEFFLTMRKNVAISSTSPKSWKRK